MNVKHAYYYIISLKNVGAISTAFARG